MQALTRLIQKIAEQPATEDLILFVADDSELVRQCLELREILDKGSKQDLAPIDALCRKYGIARDVLSREIHHILAIFSPSAVDNEYAVLGLGADATAEQVKQAFRRLSVRYHPDSSGKDTGDKFMEICQAYKTIISRPESGAAAALSPGASSWQYGKKQDIYSRNKWKNMYIFAALAVLLFVISLVLPHFFSKKVMLKNLNTADPVAKGKTVLPELPPSKH